MGKLLKKGKSGNAAQYLTRTQAVKKLQLRLSEFRRLCILKGIHPREPKKKVKGANKTYYHVKDINWLAHEPLIVTLRAAKAHERKVKKARAKHNIKLARRLLAATPKLRLDHLVRERYPSFVDALRDLDDALTLAHLFAALPAEGRYGIPPEAVARCRRLALEWQAYVARTGALRRTFISVKGFYYQAEVHGQSVTWLVPHGLAQVLPPDVDYRVMLTFLDFYSTLLRFVMFKLYHGLGLRYPPLMDDALSAQAAELAAIMADIAGLQSDRSAIQSAAAAAADAAAKTAGAAAAAAAAAAEGAAPDIVARLSSLGDKIRQLKGRGGGGSDDGSGSDGEGLGIDSGEGGSSEEEEDSEAGGSEEEVGTGEGEEGEEEEEEEGSSGDEGPEEEGGSEEGAEAGGGAQQRQQQQQQQQQQQAAAAAVGGEAAAVAGGALGVAPDDDAAVCAALFRGCVFFLAREVPREPLLFVIRAFGGVAAWEGEGSPHAESDEAVTHQVVDRPVQGHRFLSRAYVQPQWAVDSANARVLLPAELYAPGRAPPPHLSPFVDHEAEGYTPEFAETVARLQEAARRARERAAGLSSEAAAFAEDAAADGDGEDGGGAGGGAQDAAALERAYLRELRREAAGAAAAAEEGGGDGGGGSSSGSEGEEEGGAAGAAARGGGEEDAGEALAAMMMTRKNRKFYERIQRAQAGKAERVGVLEARRAALEKAQGKAPATPAARDTRAAAAAKKKREGAGGEQRVATVEPTLKKRRP
ncbi:hypothetical protein Rsub_11279 [Raphidocelis subcapitata]|uniref:Pescadillo homolog n=1 Tax=Raphidocelis subcapitata TaxID=307507 RepID=A0A2V0PLK9_9CHLO|nr:hypothetical protein Rsub_11279 [Raphidocelis subcapitata]|eukprot:GBF98730.1 hypothetical protein Rsub_11279 [Raphidocelis subcapitata]